MVPVVAVIGSGVMGTGLAQDLAQTGHRVIVIDIFESALNRARLEIERNLKVQQMLHPESTRESSPTILQRIEWLTGYSRLAEADFVIENVTESWAAKKLVWERIDE